MAVDKVADTARYLAGAEWAAWVQAGAITLGIFASFIGLKWQSRRQYDDAVNLREREREQKEYDLAETLIKVAIEGRWCMTVGIGQLQKASGATEVKTRSGDEFNPVMIRELEAELSSVRLLELPSKMVRPMLKVRGDMRIFIQDMDYLIENIGKLPEDRIGMYLRLMDDRRSSLAGTIKELEGFLEELKQDALSSG